MIFKGGSAIACRQNECFLLHFDEDYSHIMLIKCRKMQGMPNVDFIHFESCYGGLFTNA